MMKTNRLLYILLGILILVNAFMLVHLLQEKRHEKLPHPPRLSFILNMKGKEAEWVDSEFKQHIAEKSRYLEQQQQLRTQINLDKSSSLQNQRIYEKIGAIQTKIDACTFEHFTRVKAHCNASQAKKLAEVVHRMIEFSGRPGPRP